MIISMRICRGTLAEWSGSQNYIIKADWMSSLTDKNNQKHGCNFLPLPSFYFAKFLTLGVILGVNFRDFCLSYKGCLKLWKTKRHLLPDIVALSLKSYGWRSFFLKTSMNVDKIFRWTFHFSTQFIMNQEK